MSKRNSRADASKMFEAIQAKVRTGYPSVVEAREQAELVAIALEATNIAVASLSKLISKDVPADQAKRQRAAVDERMSQLRDFCRTLVGAVCDEFKLTDRWPWLLELKARLSGPPAPGTEVVDASLVLVSAAKVYLTFLLQVDVAGVVGLPCETLDDHIDEEARSQLPAAASDLELARMKQFADDKSKCDFDEMEALRKDARRRRHVIKAYVARGWAMFQEQLDDATKVIASSLKPDSPDSVRLAETRAALADSADPSTMRAFKQWYTLGGHLGVFEVDDIALRTGKPRKRQSELARSAVRF